MDGVHYLQKRKFMINSLVSKEKKMKYIKKFLEVLFKWKFKPVSEKKYREADAIVTQAYSVLKKR